MHEVSSWFKTEKLSTTICRIWEPRVHLFFRANFYLVKGRDADLVVDFGMGLKPLRPFLDFDDGKPIIALATHVHVDHVGSLHEFEHRLGHNDEADAFSTMLDVDTLAHLFRQQPDCVTQKPDADWSSENYKPEPAPLSLTVDEGSLVDVGDTVYRVLHLPGHSPGSIALLDEKTGTLFSGDAIYDGGLVDDLPGCNKGQYRRTMERLRQLDISIAYGGHGQPMSRARMKHIAETYLNTSETAN